MTTRLYLFILIKIIIFFGSIAITSELFSDSHELFGDTFIDMDDKNNWQKCPTEEGSYTQIMDCIYNHEMSYATKHIDHWHWSWLHIWLFWASICINILNLISIIISIKKRVNI